MKIINNHKRGLVYFKDTVVGEVYRFGSAFHLICEQEAGFKRAVNLKNGQILSFQPTTPLQEVEATLNIEE